jgi:hypothetical protein
MRFALLLILLILSINCVSAQVVKIECSPSVLFPGDVADCKLTFTHSKETYISGISIFSSSEVEVIPSSVSGVGWVTSYELPFNVKAKVCGIHTLTAYINTINGTIKQSFNIVTVEDMPKLILNKTTLYLNEVNTVGFKVVSPFPISNVIVKPLFQSDPQIVYGDQGFFKFIPDKKPLKFEISFYNGRNHHVVIQSINVSYEESRGVVVNVTPSYSMSLIGDVVTISVELSNLRGDDIYNIVVKSNAEPYVLTIPHLKSGESKRLDFKFSSNESGLKEVVFDIEYKDEFNNPYRLTAKTSIKILDEYALQFSGVEVKRNLGIEVGGDICNNGRTKAYNIYVIAEANGVVKTYYIDSLEPSDFDSFEFTLENASVVKLKARWNNELGEIFEIEKIVKSPPLIVKEEKEGNIYVPLAVLIAVIALIVLAWRRRNVSRTRSEKLKKD